MKIDPHSMKIVLAPDSFKGSMTAAQACQAMHQGIQKVLPHAQIVSVPMADGGEGTVEALVASRNGQLITTTAHGPLGDPVDADWGIIHDADGTPTAIIEMAAASGLPLVPEDQRNPLNATTFGVGELILHALDYGCRSFVLGIGGSATNDGGSGMAQALGARFYDDKDNEITDFMTGRLMARVARVDAADLNPAAQQSTFTVACDVDNPLLGPEGATYIYGPQKGADDKILLQLETAMTHLYDIIEPALGKSVRHTPGAGAAGGLGAALMAWLDATLDKGIGIVIDFSGLQSALQPADLVITGEGRIDGSTIYGKTISGVYRSAAQVNVPVIAVAGSIGAGHEKVLDMGVTALFSICRYPMPLQQAMLSGPELLRDTTEQIIRAILVLHNK